MKIGVVLWITIISLFLEKIKTSFVFTDILNSISMITAYMDFNPLIINGIDCTIKIQVVLDQTAASSSSSSASTLITNTSSSQLYYDVVSTTCAALTSPKQNYQIWNFQSTTIQYRIQLTFPTNSQYFQSLYQTQLYFSIQKQDQMGITKNQIKKYFTAVLIKSQISSLILPFNLLSTKNIKVFVNSLNTLELTIKNYNIVPFLETYWNQIDASQILTPWLPFFSNCQKFTPRIFLHQIISTNNCYINRNIFGFKQFHCNQQSFKFQCILQQLNVQNIAKDFWWNTKNQILYHLLPSQLTSLQLGQYLINNNLQSALTEQTFKKLIPVIYKNNIDSSSPDGIPNYFQFIITVLLNSDYSIQIKSASLQSYYYQSLKLTANHAVLNVTIHYQQFWQKLWNFHSSYAVYAGSTFILNISIIFILHYIFKCCKIRLKILQKFKLIIFPVLKGFFYMLVVGFTFLLIFFFISSATKFSVIATGFNGDPSVGLSDNYNGRNGLMLCVIGVFLLIISIHQSFKVPSNQETHILLQDDLDQKSKAMHYILRNKKNSSNNNIQNQNQNSRQKKDDDYHNFFQNQHDLDNPQKIAEKQTFIIKNLQSQRKCLLLYILTILLVLLYFYFNFSKFQYWQLCLTLSLTYPFAQKLIIMAYRHYIIKQYLYLHGTLILYETFFCIFILRAKTVQQFYLYYSLKLIAQIIIEPFFQFVCQYFIIILDRKPDRNCITLRLWIFFKDFIRQISNQSQYQKSIFYSGLITCKISTSYFKPIFLIILYLTLDQNKLYTTLYFVQSQFIVVCIMMIMMIPIQNYLVLVSARILETGLGLKISQSIDFNNFKFMRRKIKWLNDSFALNRNISNFYRQFQKFSFSSQLYLISFLLVLAQSSILIGIIIIIESGYVMYQDPVLLVIIMIVMLSGIILSFVLSFLVIKFRLYQKKQEGKMRAKLQNTQKLLKKKDYSQYLQLDSIKNHFMMFNMNWIVNNLTTLFSKQDFQENNCQILTKYKYYKSIAKKKQLQAKKYKQKYQNNYNQYQQQKQIIQKQNHPLLKHGISICIPKTPFEKYAKPLIYSWFYLAKQNLYLKLLIKQLKMQKLLSTCQFCNMDIQLQVVQKKQFNQIINQFRVINVGRFFNQKAFIDYYRQHQQFITTCVQCKDKKCHLQKKQIKNGANKRGGVAGNLIKRWMMITKSKMLHNSNKGFKNKYYQY